MRNITLSADETLIEKARAKAAASQTTLNQLFRDWLVEYADRKEGRAEEIEAVLKKCSYFRVGKMPTRDEMHER